MIKLKEFWEKYEFRLVLGVVLVLITSISFEFGYIQVKSFKTSPLVIEKPSESAKNDLECKISAASISNNASAQKTPKEPGLAPANNQIAGQTDCVYVGSKNSDKYHVATCSWAKRILPKNLVCFKTAEAAVAQGRVGDKGCIK